MAREYNVKVTMRLDLCDITVEKRYGSRRPEILVQGPFNCYELFRDVFVEMGIMRDIENIARKLDRIFEMPRPVEVEPR